MQIELLHETKIEPITTKEAKTYLRIDHDYEDNIIETIISAARVYAEQYLRCSLVHKQYRLEVNDFTGYKLQLCFGPVNNIEKITTEDHSGKIDELKSHYIANNILYFARLVYVKKIKIQYWAGHDLAKIPAAIKQAMLIHIASLFEDRAGNNAVPPAAIALYKPYRLILI